MVQDGEKIVGGIGKMILNELEKRAKKKWQDILY